MNANYKPEKAGKSAVKAEEKTALVKEETVKKETAVKAPAEKKAAAKKSTEKKPAAKKPAEKKVAAKKEVSQSVVVEYGERQVNVEDMVKNAKAAFVADGHKEADIKDICLYVKPEDAAVYYVINNESKGKIDF